MVEGTEYLSTTPVRRSLPIVLALKTDKSLTALNFKVTKASGNFMSSPVKLNIDFLI